MRRAHPAGTDENSLYVAEVRPGQPDDRVPGGSSLLRVRSPEPAPGVTVPNPRWGDSVTLRTRERDR